jgi:hypothetical protein
LIDPFLYIPGFAGRIQVKNQVALTMTPPLSLPGTIRQSIPMIFQLVRAAEWMPGSKAGHDG